MQEEGNVSDIVKLARLTLDGDEDAIEELGIDMEDLCEMLCDEVVERNTLIAERDKEIERLRDILRSLYGNPSSNDWPDVLKRM